MGRLSRCGMALVSFLLLVLLSPAAATGLHSDVMEHQVYSIGGRRGLLQATTPPTPAATPPTPAATPPTPAATPPTPAATPPTPAATPPTPAATPPTPAATPPTPAATPPTPAATPPTPAATPPTTTGATPPVRSPAPGVIPPALAPAPIAPAPAPIGVTNEQKRNAVIAISVVGGVIVIAAILIFCRCRFLKRSKKMPFQRLQMT